MFLGINMGMSIENFKITPEILSLIAEIDEFKGIKTFQELIVKDFAGGVVLYTGK